MKHFRPERIVQNVSECFGNMLFLQELLPVLILETFFYPTRKLIFELVQVNFMVQLQNETVFCAPTEVEKLD